MTILVTGGAGFIGANFVQTWLGDESAAPLVNLDKLSYAGNLRSLESVASDARYRFVHGDIGDAALVARLLAEHRPTAIVNFAAETHVDRSILGPAAFVATNVVGTSVLLEAARAWWLPLPAAERDAFRFLHVSTDEVYGSLGASDAPFRESTPFAPNSPYSASKAASDHFVRAYHHTYGLPTLTTNCSNNYGPYQFPEKLIPVVILKALRGEPLPIYGDGLNVRDWMYVRDHCDAIRAVLRAGVPGTTYNVGGKNEMTNLEVVRAICALLDELRPAPRKHAELITFVKDRPGHDRRYAIDPSAVETAIGWRPRETFASGIRKTVEWYLANEAWVSDVTSGSYREWMDRNYSKRGT